MGLRRTLGFSLLVELCFFFCYARNEQLLFNGFRQVPYSLTYMMKTSEEFVSRQLTGIWERR